MPSARCLLIAAAALAFAVPAVCAPAPFPRPPAAGRIPVGRWKVVFTNGVVETCTIQKDGKASVVEPKRSSGGKVSLEGGAAVLVFTDDRVERWTLVGRRMEVEHWFPAARFPKGAPVRGRAERAP
jgi:hypothetical protein